MQYRKHESTAAFRTCETREAGTAGVPVGALLWKGRTVALAPRLLPSTDCASSCDIAAEEP